MPKKTLQEYLDGELPEAQSRRVEKHLTGCKKCSQRLADSKAQNNLVRKRLSLLDPVEIPAAPAISPGIWRYELPRKSEIKRLFAATIRVPAAAVATAVLFVAGFFLGITLRSRGEGGPVPRGETKSTPFYVSTADHVQVLSLNWDLTDYKPIEHPRIIVIKEEQK
jgi:predicted anti-sigma-YlaC factor YlaD